MTTLTTSRSSASLRERAEAVLRTSSRQVEHMSLPDIQRLVHELQVHQIELEMQNEELRRTQDELAEARDRYTDLYDFAPVGYFTLDKNMSILQANLTAATLLGATRANLVGQRITRYIAPESADAFYLYQRALRDGNGKEGCELVLRRPNGVTFPVQMNGVVVKEPAQGAAACRCVITDVTERRRAADALIELNAHLEERVDERTIELGRVNSALRASETLFRTLANSAPVLIWASGPDKGCIWFNQPWLDFVGRPMRQELGRGWTDHVHPEDLPQCLRTYTMAFEAQKPFRMEYRLKRKDEEYRWFLDMGAPLYSPEGQFHGFIGSCVDITERRQAEEAVRLSEERFRLVAAAANDAIWDADLVKGTVWWNQAYQRRFERPAATAGSWQWWIDRIHPEDRERVSSSLRAARNGSSDEWAAEYRFRLPKGEWAFILHRAHIARNARGEAVRILGAILDLTRMKDRERQLAERTAELTRANQRLEAEAAERHRLESAVIRISDHERQRIAADLHDGVCQELAGLAFVTAALQKDLRRADPGELAQRLKAITRKMAEIAGHTRQAARGMSPVVAEGKGLAIALRQFAASTAMVHRIHCRFLSREEVSIDDSRVANELYRIVQEAVRNSVIHGRAKRVVIGLTARSERIRLTVRDNGKGLPARPSSNNGMGLQVMRHRAELLGGSLVVQNRRGGGTEIICQIPKRTSVA